MTNLELIEETIQYYSENTTRRGFDDQKQMCVYKSPDNKHCAIGRMLDEEVLYEHGLSWYELNETGDLDVIVQDANIDIFELDNVKYTL